MSYPQFEELQVWQKARELAGGIHTQLASVSDSALADQLQRSSMYLMNNIAKGMERKGSTEFERFLYIARGYCGELKSSLYLAEDLGLIPTAQRESWHEDVITVAKMLSGLLKSIYAKKDKAAAEEAVA
ncbi:MAG TPA: four helix bundle protein [Candidatus Wirthbacteria bacterium]|nr:four helix bundle protein [Candidatus Wirthbacteria bacterium]